MIEAATHDDMVSAHENPTPAGRGATAKRWAAAVVVAVLLVGSAADSAEIDGSNLRLFLLGVQDMNTPQTVLRADIDGEVTVAGTSRKLQAVAVFPPGKDARWYLQLREPALRALVLGSERKVMQHVGSKTETVPIGAVIDALDIAYEDLSRFIADDFKTWQITDQGTDTVLVGMHPAVASAYVYRAALIDKEKQVPLRTQLYAKTLNNLVKLRLDGEHVLIGKKWLPTTIELQNYPEDATVKLHVRWSPNAPVPPELLAPASFATSPPLAWEAPPHAAAPQPAASPSPKGSSQ